MQSPTYPFEEEHVSTEAIQPTAQPTTKKRFRRRSHLRKYWRRYLILIAVLGAALALGFMRIMDAADNAVANGKARDAAVEVYASELNRDTRGAIAIDVMSQDTDYPNAYVWNSDERTLTVVVKLGSCEVSGYFAGVPNRPAHVSKIGVLYLIVPSVNPEVQAAHIPVDSKNLYAELKSSGLAHCIASDTRLLFRYDG